MIRYSIVVPTLNERENILLLIGRIEKSGLENYEIIVADENSPDGTAAAVNAYAASSFFALDRYASYMTDWKNDCARGAVILANRYTTSNAVHQLSKLPESEWEPFLDWLYGYEYGLLGIPKPDLVLFLRVPPALSYRMAERRSAETGAAKDIHESDLRHLEASAHAAQYVAGRDGWVTVECAAGERYRTREDIAANAACARFTRPTQNGKYTASLTGTCWSRR